MTSDLDNLELDSDWEDAILEYAIDTFPYMDTLEYMHGAEADDREVLAEMIEGGLIQIGFYYEDLQESLTIFYFLNIEEGNYLVLGLDPSIRVEIPDDLEGIFRLDDEQYMDLLQITPC